MNKGKTIFAQLMSLFTEYEFSKCVKRYNGDRHAIKFNCRDQFLVMSFAQFTNRSGLRDIETTLDLCSQDLYRSGLKIMPKSTLTEASIHDSKVMDEIPVVANAYYLLDKGYVKFDSLYKHFHQNHAWFVTRAKDNMLYTVTESREVDTQTGLISDETIQLTGFYTSQKYPDNLRLVVYEDFRDGKVYRFLTNNFSIDALTVAELYRERWQIEIFFKWIKQHLHIKTFYGTTRNAVYTQIWIAICDYLLLIIAKKQYGLKPSLHTISNSIGQILFKRGDIRDFYNKPDEPVNVPEDDSNRQLTLW